MCVSVVRVRAMPPLSSRFYLTESEVARVRPPPRGNDPSRPARRFTTLYITLYPTRMRYNVLYTVRHRSFVPSSAGCKFSDPRWWKYIYYDSMTHVRVQCTYWCAIKTCVDICNIIHLYRYDIRIYGRRSVCALCIILCGG